MLVPYLPPFDTMHSDIYYGKSHFHKNHIQKPYLEQLHHYHLLCHYHPSKLQYLHFYCLNILVKMCQRTNLVDLNFSGGYQTKYLRISINPFF
ncbi:MAG: hypothetical protein ALMCE001_13040 [Methanocorpusculum sp. MCE]|nr:MAG: hypothetical protein ALMCE001_12930 [Methanocorpusculum sp. MCE]RBQ24412.1 MAG: hypothetical protein ALMCE001_13040 [Methanocorpusculum sp. MCE]